MKKLIKSFDGMDQHNAWDFETQYKANFFKLKLENFKLKVKIFRVDRKKDYLLLSF
jgi:ATP-binding cassette subfamily F protein uup